MADPLDALRKLSGMKPVPSHAPAEPQPIDPMTALSKASGIGPEHPSLIGPTYGVGHVNTPDPGPWQTWGVTDVINKGLQMAGLQGGGNAGTVPVLPEINPAAYDAVQGLSGKFYSRLTDAAHRLPEVAHPNKIASYLSSQAAPEEMQYRGLSDFLKAQGNRMVPRSEVLSHLEQNPIVLGEKVLGEHSGIHDPRFTSGEMPGEARYSAYQLPGGTNYKERLTTLPYKEVPDINTHPEMGFTHPEPLYQDPHWEDPNVMLHTRTQERTLPHPLQGTTDPESGAVIGPHGDPGTMIENVQSGWHQTGAKSGYRVGPPAPDRAYDSVRQELETAIREHAEAVQRSQELSLDYPESFMDDNGPPEVMLRAWDMEERLYQRRRELEQTVQHFENIHNMPSEHGTPVPDAPFKKSWPDLGLKQELYDTAKSPNLSWVGVTPGEALVARGEGHSPAFNNVTLPKKLGDILKPFGGSVEQAGLPGPERRFATDVVAHRDPSAELTGKARPIIGLEGQIFENDPLTGAEGAKHIASTWPMARPTYDVREINDTIHSNPVFSAPSRDDAIKYINDQMSGSGALTLNDIDAREQAHIAALRAARTIGAQPAFQAKDIPFNLAHLTPEMKAAIVKRGFPIMSLMGLMHAGSHDQGQ